MGAVEAEAEPYQSQSHSAMVTLPPLSTIILLEDK
jgi:hypothetical protein